MRPRQRLVCALTVLVCALTAALLVSVAEARSTAGEIVGWCVLAAVVAIGLGVIVWRKSQQPKEPEKDPEQGGPPKTVTVTVPPGAKPGETTTFTLADGRKIEAVIPPGVAHGAPFQVKV